MDIIVSHIIHLILVCFYVKKTLNAYKTRSRFTASGH